jgi:ABC-type antimicrobial peptide transport system permease subunit
LILLSLFLGGMASVVGVLMGLVVLVLMQQGKGIPLNPEVYFIDRIPVHFETSWFLFALIGSVALCWLTSFVAGRVVLKRWSEKN